jgi:hypothetical protein
LRSVFDALQYESASSAQLKPLQRSESIASDPRLSLFDSLTIVAGTTIGSGIFIVSAGIAGDKPFYRA